jgi:hypothetical protein
MLRGAALIAWLAVPVPALAQDNVVATATLPRDLSPWGMYLNADPVVKAVLIGLALASVVTWTVWLAKTIELIWAKRRVRAALNGLVRVRSTAEAIERLADAQGEVMQFLDAAVTELKICPPTEKASRNESRRASSASKQATGDGSRAAPACLPPSVRLPPSSVCSAPSGAS